MNSSRVDASTDLPATETVACSGCGETAVEVLIPDCRDFWFQTPGSFPVSRCTRCSLVRTEPRPTPDALGAFYPPEYRPDGVRGPEDPVGDSAFTRSARKFAGLAYRLRFGRSRIDRLRPGRAIDIGGGEGRRLRQLRDAGWEVSLMEPRLEAAERAARALELPEERVVVAYAEEADLPERSFDLVVMDHVVEHLSDPAAALVSIGRWLKPGGTLFVTCPNFGSVERKLFGRYWTGLDVPRHLFHFTPESLAELASRADLEPVDIRPQFGVLLAQSIRWKAGLDHLTGWKKKALGTPLRAAAFATELVMLVGQTFGYMPMMEIAFVRGSRQEP